MEKEDKEGRTIHAHREAAGYIEFALGDFLKLQYDTQDHVLKSLEKEHYAAWRRSPEGIKHMARVLASGTYGTKSVATDLSEKKS